VYSTPIYFTIKEDQDISVPRRGCICQVWFVLSGRLWKTSIIKKELVLINFVEAVEKIKIQCDGYRSLGRDINYVFRLLESDRNIFQTAISQKEFVTYGLWRPGKKFTSDEVPGSTTLVKLAIYYFFQNKSIDDVVALLRKYLLRSRLSKQKENRGLFTKEGKETDLNQYIRNWQSELYQRIIDGMTFEQVKDEYKEKMLSFGYDIFKEEGEGWIKLESSLKGNNIAV